MERQITLEQVVGAFTDALRNSIYICFPGSVVAYDAASQTADVQPMLNDVRFDLDTGAAVFEPWQVIKAVPVAWPRFGGFTISGPLAPKDQVVLQAFDLDPSPWRAQGRSGTPVNPHDVRRHGGNYWRCIPTDLTGPIADAAAAGKGAIFGVDGDAAQIRFQKGLYFGAPWKILLGSTASSPVAMADHLATALTNACTAAVAAVVPGDGGAAAFAAFASSLSGAASSYAATIVNAE